MSNLIDFACEHGFEECEAFFNTIEKAADFADSLKGDCDIESPRKTGNGKYRVVYARHPESGILFTGDPMSQSPEILAVFEAMAYRQS